MDNFHLGGIGYFVIGLTRVTVHDHKIHAGQNSKDNANNVGSSRIHS